MKDLLIFPFSGSAVEALDCLGNTWNCVGFISDDVELIGKEFYGVPVFDRIAFKRLSQAMVLAVNGSPTSYTKRAEIITSLSIENNRFATVIHPKAEVSPRAEIGYNVLLMAGVVVTANAKLGNHIVILPNTVVHHDSCIGDYTLIASQVTIAGNVHIERNCYLGASSSIKNGVTIGEGSLIGIGANVIQPFPGGSKVVGNPAKNI